MMLLLIRKTVSEFGADILRMFKNVSVMEFTFDSCVGERPKMGVYTGVDANDEE